MRPLALLAMLLCVAAFTPVAQAELREVGGGAGGATIGLTWGVTGAQLDQDTGLGLRYWHNSTRGQWVTLHVTGCAQTDTDAGYCERKSLNA